MIRLTNNIEIIAPYVTDEEYKYLKSDFTLMKNYNDFCELTNALNKYGRYIFSYFIIFPFNINYYTTIYAKIYFLYHYPLKTIFALLNSSYAFMILSFPFFLTLKLKSVS